MSVPVVIIGVSSVDAVTPQNDTGWLVRGSIKSHRPYVFVTTCDCVDWRVFPNMSSPEEEVVVVVDVIRLLFLSSMPVTRLRSFTA